MKKILMLVAMLCLATSARAAEGTYETITKPYTDANMQDKAIASAVQAKLADLFKNSNNQADLLTLLNGKDSAKYRMYAVYGGSLSIIKVDAYTFNVNFDANDAEYALINTANKSELELKATPTSRGTDAELQVKYAEYNGYTYAIIKYSADRSIQFMGSDLTDVYDVLTLKKSQPQN